MLIESDQAAVERPDVHFAAIEGHAAIYDVATNEEGALARHLGIVGPADLSGLRVDGVHHAPGTGGVDDAVFHQRRRFQSARGAELAAPGQAQLADGFLVDLFQRTEAVVVVSPPVHQPIACVLIAVFEVSRRRGALCRLQEPRRRTERTAEAIKLRFNMEETSVMLDFTGQH